MWDRAVEVIDPSAFDNALDGDIRALVNHDATLVLGRTLSNTLRLNVDNIGLYGSITINANDQDAMNLYERVKRRDVTQCSFGFDILDQQILERPDGITVFNVRKVKLYEVSICTFPAYENTNVEARKKDYEAQKNKELKEWRSKMKCKIKK